MQGEAQLVRKAFRDAVIKFRGVGEFDTRITAGS